MALCSIMCCRYEFLLHFMQIQSIIWQVMNYDQIDSDSCFWHITSSCIYRSDRLVCPGIKGKIANKRSRRTTAVKRNMKRHWKVTQRPIWVTGITKRIWKMAMRSPVYAANIISTNWKNVSMIWLWKCMTAVWCEPKSSI